jgi:HEAT repeat protein
MHVPLLIRFPEKYSGLAPSAAGKTVNRLVNFADFAPTMLSLAGIDSVPTFMRGHAFLGPLDDARREFVFGHRDRVDEIIDMARSVRSKNYLYIRNYMPHLGYNQQSAWIDQGEVRKDFYALAESGNATAAQAQYLRQSRPREELYDCNADPMNLENLANSPPHRTILEHMRDAGRARMRVEKDLGLVPEIELWRQSKGTTPYAWARTEAFNARLVLRAAELVGTDDFSAIAEALNHPNASVRYWAVVSCRAAPSNLPANLEPRLLTALTDESLAVRIEAAGAVAHRLANPKGLETLVGLLDQSDQTVVLHATRTIELLGDRAAREPMQKLADRYKDEPGDIAWFIRFSTSGYLNRLEK